MTPKELYEEAEKTVMLDGSIEADLFRFSQMALQLNAFPSLSDWRTWIAEWQNESAQRGRRIFHKEHPNLEVLVVSRDLNLLTEWAKAWSSQESGYVLVEREVDVLRSGVVATKAFRERGSDGALYIVAAIDAKSMTGRFSAGGFGGTIPHWLKLLKVRLDKKQLELARFMSEHTRTALYHANIKPLRVLELP